jgi:tetratricopeptide (TPR) repeat protein
MIERNLDNHEEGIALAERALKIREEALGPDHLEVAQSLDQIGSAYVHRGDFERALEAHQRSLDIRLAQLPEDHPWLAYPHVGLGKAYLERGDAEEAAKHFDRARALREAAGSDAGERGEAIYLLATAKLAAGDRVAAAELGKRAQALLQSEQLPGSDTIGAWLDDNGLR